MLNRKTRWIVWVAILLLSTVMRLPGSNWDSGFALHPDERYLIDMSSKMKVYGDPCSIDPHYPYGHLPLNMVLLLFPPANGVDALYPARLLSGIIGVLLVAVTGASGKKLGQDRVGWFSTLAIVFAPLLVQSARFYTVDTMATTAATLAVLAVLHKRWAIAGISGAVAIASKISLIWVWPVLILAVFLHGGSTSPKRTTFPGYHYLRSLSVMVVWGAVTYVVASPWMLLNPLQCWAGPMVQWQMATGSVVYPYTLQYVGTLPYIYPLKQMAFWGLGPVLTLIGVGTASVNLAYWRKTDRVQRIVLVWVVWYAVVMAGLFVKFPRYYLPLYPWLSILAGQGIMRLLASRSHRALGLLGMLLCLLPTVVMGFAQASIYGRTHPWVQASEWLTHTLNPGDTVAYEAWDYPLPLLDVPNPYTMVELPIYDDESREKAAELARIIDSADVIVIASRRGIGALSQNGERFADTLLWYKRLLLEREALVFTQCPQFGPISFSDDVLFNNNFPEIDTLIERCHTRFVLRLPQLDESFRVYDAPIVILLFQTQR